MALCSGARVSTAPQSFRKTHLAWRGQTYCVIYCSAVPSITVGLAECLIRIGCKDCFLIKKEPTSQGILWPTLLCHTAYYHRKLIFEPGRWGTYYLPISLICRPCSIWAKCNFIVQFGIYGRHSATTTVARATDLVTTFQTFCSMLLQIIMSASFSQEIFLHILASWPVMWVTVLTLDMLDPCVRLTLAHWPKSDAITDCSNRATTYMSGWVKVISDWDKALQIYLCCHRYLLIHQIIQHRNCWSHQDCLTYVRDFVISQCRYTHSCSILKI